MSCPAAGCKHWTDEVKGPCHPLLCHKIGALKNILAAAYINNIFIHPCMLRFYTEGADLSQLVAQLKNVLVLYKI